MHLVLSFSLWEDFLAREILCSIKKRLFPLNVVDTVDKIRAETISKGSRAEERRKEKMYKWRKHNKRREVKETVEGLLLSFPLAADDRGHSRGRQVHNTWQLNIWYIFLWGQGESYGRLLPHLACLSLSCPGFTSKFPCLLLLGTLSSHLLPLWSAELFFFLSPHPSSKSL